MAEIVVGLLGLVIELGKCITEPIKRQFIYLCCFNNNVQNLNDEAEKLEVERASLQMTVDTEENRGKVVDPKVKTWLENASHDIQQKMHGINEEIKTTRNGGSTVRSRFSLSKKVKKTADAMKELRQSCNFKIVAHSPPPAAMVPILLGSALEFQSRKQMEEEIMASLRDGEANIFGICGMGGVGKTTMAKRVMHRAREAGFEETVMAVVSQTVDKARIQDDIARSLGLELGGGSLSSKAHNLRTRLSAGRKRSLIVLDDVWDNLNLEDLGIPCDSGCKILLTSRNRDVFNGMSVEKVHAVKVLDETEAWDLFKSKAGSCIDDENVVSVAQQVVKECNGLPIALVTVGVALKDVVNISRWKAALRQLKSSNPNHIGKVIEDVYQPLRFSYECLRSNEEKSLFLLCCLFPEDYDIPLEDLAIYAMGLRISEDITSLELARERVGSLLVERLKSRFLLLEGEDENHVKMHDVVRDVAIFIASEEKRIKCNDCTWISPSIGERVVGSVFPNLHLLWIDRESRDKELEMCDGFFNGMGELNVLSIKCESLQLLPETTELLKNLRTLILEECESVKSISVVGELVNLEILICRDCDSIESLPVEMRRLSRLRLLELSRCSNLKTIAPGIISYLKGLEELIVKGCFDGWEADNEEREGKNASLSEVIGLPSLTRLKIKIKDCRLGVEQMRLSPNIVKYDITIGNLVEYNSRFEKKIVVELPVNITLGNWIHECVRSVEYFHVSGEGSRNLDFGAAQKMRWLSIKECSTVKKLVSMKTTSTVFPLLEVLMLENLTELVEIFDTDGPMQSNSFNNLKKLTLDNQPALEHLWKTSITPFHQQHNVVSIFNNLSTIVIQRCNKLCSFFSCSMMTRGSCLVQLERLHIHHCDMMEQVILWKEDENQTDIHITQLFPKLKLLDLYHLPRLTSLSKIGIQSIQFLLPPQMFIWNCPLLESCVSSTHHDADDNDDSIHLFCKPNKVEFGSLRELFIGEYDSTRRNWCPMIDFFSGLEELRIYRIQGMKSLFSSSMARNLVNIRDLTIEECAEMASVIEDDDGETTTPQICLFPNLEKLHLHLLPKLKSFCEWRCALQLPSLKELEIEKCDVMDEFIPGSLNAPNLENIKIDREGFSGKDVNSALQIQKERKRTQNETAEEAAEREAIIGLE